jgi:hypothetical protein
MLDISPRTLPRPYLRWRIRHCLSGNGRNQPVAEMVPLPISFRNGNSPSRQPLRR